MEYLGLDIHADPQYSRSKHMTNFTLDMAFSPNCCTIDGIRPRSVTAKLLTHTAYCRNVGIYRFASNALLGGGIRVRVWIRTKKDQKKIKGTTRPVMANLDITLHIWWISVFPLKISSIRDT